MSILSEFRIFASRQGTPNSLFILREQSWIFLSIQKFVPNAPHGSDGGACACMRMRTSRKRSRCVRNEFLEFLERSQNAGSRETYAQIFSGQYFTKSSNSRPWRSLIPSRTKSAPNSWLLTPIPTLLPLLAINSRRREVLVSFS